MLSTVIIHNVHQENAARFRMHYFSLWNDSYLYCSDTVTHAYTLDVHSGAYTVAMWFVLYSICVCLFICVCVSMQRRGLVVADCARSSRPLPVRAELSQLVSIRLVWHPDPPRQPATGNDGTWNRPQRPCDPVCRNRRARQEGGGVRWDGKLGRQCSYVSSQ